MVAKQRLAGRKTTTARSGVSEKQQRNLDAHWDLLLKIYSLLEQSETIQHSAILQNRKTAVRLVQQEAQQRSSAVDAAAPSEQSYNQAFCGDSETVLKHFPNKTLDHAITDPPWLKFFNPKLTIDKRTLPVFKELYRVLKYNSFLLVVCGLENYHYYAGTDLTRYSRQFGPYQG